MDHSINWIQTSAPTQVRDFMLCIVNFTWPGNGDWNAMLQCIAFNVILQCIPTNNLAYITLVQCRQCMALFGLAYCSEMQFFQYVALLLNCIYCNVWHCIAPCKLNKTLYAICKKCTWRCFGQLLLLFFLASCAENRASHCGRILWWRP